MALKKVIGLGFDKEAAVNNLYANLGAHDKIVGEIVVSRFGQSYMAAARLDMSVYEETTGDEEDVVTGMG